MSMFRSARILRVALIILGLVSLYAGGLAMRRSVLHTQQVALGEDLPFTLESALHYRRIKMLFDRGFLPEVDAAIQHPEGIRIRDIDAVASEPVQAFLAGWFRESVAFPDRIRWIEAGWFCLAIPLLAVALRIWTGSWWAGVVAGALYAFSLASVLRSTGQEISRENFAVPWMVAAFVFSAASLRGAGAIRGVRAALLNGGAALCLALGLIGWDMTQFVVVLITLAMSVHVIRRRAACDCASLKLFTAMTLAVFLVGLFDPYHRFHGLAYSPLMIWMASVTFSGWSITRTPAMPRYALLAIIFGPAALTLLFGLTGSYGSSYGHFAELIWAKIRFLNSKPADPAALTYYQRVMWVPSLHSANWGLTKWLFPITLWIVVLLAVFAWFDSRKRPDPLLRFWVLFLGVSIIAYVLMVRFHVFAAFATAVLAGWAVGRAGRAGPGWKVAALAVASVALIVEAGHTWREQPRMGRPNVYYEEMKEMAHWLREHVAPAPVLANMGISAYIAAYAKCPIVIHPKFEDPTIRARFHDYGERLFGDDEKSFRDWMDQHQVAYFVYAKGEFASVSPELQMRYFVNRMDPPETSPARRFERDDDALRYFTLLWSNRKYAVYQALSQEQETAAAAMAGEAMDALQQGRLAEAEALAIRALAVDRHQDTALRAMRHVGSLLEQGVKVEP